MNYDDLKNRGKESAIDLLYSYDPAAALAALEKEGWGIDEDKKYVMWGEYLMKEVKMSSLDGETQERVKELREYIRNSRVPEDRVAVYEASPRWGVQSLSLCLLDVSYNWYRVEFYLVSED
jgi:hypothetical protein